MNVVFASVNVVSSRSDSGLEAADDREDFTKANLEWIDELYWEHRKRRSTFFLFAHEEVPGEGENRDFYEELFKRIEDWYAEMRFVIINRGKATNQYQIARDYRRIRNLDVVTSPGPLWPPLEVRVDTREDPRRAVSIFHGVMN